MAAVDIGSRVEMLVDDSLIAWRQGLDFRLTPPVRRETAIVLDRPWEGEGAGAYASVLEFGGRFHLYYRAGINTSGDDRDTGQCLCYATSHDGVHWEKPELGRVAFGGSRANNILLRGFECHNFTPVVDLNPACPPSERIKATAGYQPEGLFIYVSADGLSFRRLFDTPAITVGLLDSQNVLLYDPAANRYRIYSRIYQPAVPGGPCLRTILNAESADLEHWSRPVPNRYVQGPQPDELYTNATVTCPGAEHQLLAFPMRFVPNVNVVEPRRSPGISDAVFMSSRDGRLWDRRFMDSWIGGGLDRRNWTQRSMMPARGILATDPDHFSVYVLEHYCWPDARIVRYELRRHGFASLHANGRGSLRSLPLLSAGGRLLLNARTAATGRIRVGIWDVAAGCFVPGFAPEDATDWRGDATGRAVDFGGGRLTGFGGRPVELRMELELADLYAFQFDGDTTH
ncbi:MAG: hypothetical protein QM296_04910 [Bacillota bacterium]|nr:hypothetical protein [Bacillota bacterium]